MDSVRVTSVAVVEQNGFSGSSADKLQIRLRAEHASLFQFADQCAWVRSASPRYCRGLALTAKSSCPSFLHEHHRTFSGSLRIRIFAHASG